MRPDPGRGLTSGTAHEAGVDLGLAVVPAEPLLGRHPTVDLVADQVLDADHAGVGAGVVEDQALADVVVEGLVGLLGDPGISGSISRDVVAAKGPRTGASGGYGYDSVSSGGPPRSPAAEVVWQSSSGHGGPDHVLARLDKTVPGDPCRVHDPARPVPASSDGPLRMGTAPAPRECRRPVSVPRPTVRFRSQVDYPEAPRRQD
jgi:hypothetical protein